VAPGPASPDRHIKLVVKAGGDTRALVP